MPTPPPNDPLSRDLATWRVNPPRDPNFRAAVSTRIHSAPEASNWSSFARQHAGTVAALIVAGLLAGAWTGRTEARQRLEADRSSFAASYVHAMDARWMRHP